MLRLSGKTALVTGAGSGIGMTSAMVMAENGAQVVVTDLNINAAESVVKDIRDAGGKADAFECDIGKEEHIRDAIGFVMKKYRKLDVLFNNAALLSTDVLASDIDVATIPSEVWDKVMNVTLRGTMLGCQYGIRAMLESGGGSIINTSSMYGVSAFNRMPAYGVSKAAIIMLTQHVATAFGRNNIRCNAVAPGLIKTPTSESFIPEPLSKLHDEAAALPYTPTPRDIANTVLFLASDESRCLSGEVLRVDSGTTSHLPTYTDARRYFDSL